MTGALAGRDLVVVDVEGNGQSPPEIIELAALRIDHDTVTAADTRTWLIRPTQPIMPIVTRKVHGIRNADVENCPAWADVAGEVSATLTGRILVAHNASVEHRVIGNHLPNWSPPMVLDTMRLSKHVWPGLPGYGLDALITHANLEPDPTADTQHRHRAGYDTWCTWQLLCALTAQGLAWPDIVNAAALPGTIAPDVDQGALW